MSEQADRQNLCFAAVQSWGGCGTAERDLVEGHEALLGLGMQRGWQVVTHGRLSALL